MKTSALFAKVMLVIGMVTLSLSSTAVGQYNETVLFTFIHSNGSEPAGLISDAAGNIYGFTYVGGNVACAVTAGCGVIFELSNSNGTWSGKILHSFSDGNDGAVPSMIALDGSGNIYGTSNGGPKGGGVLFEMERNLSGAWKFLTIHAFPDGPLDGVNPSGLSVDTVGNVYVETSGGTNSLCSGYGCGGVFKFVRTASGQWSETLLHSFFGTPVDGASPAFGMVFDAAGNLYGTTSLGGVCAATGPGCGTVFRLSPTSSGPWQETLLHVFNGTDGWLPRSLITDQSGNLFGATFYGATKTSYCNRGCGVVFGLVLSESGWTESTLYSLSNTGDGVSPTSIVVDAADNLYVAAFNGGVGGAIDQISPNSGSTWTETTLFDFSNLPTGIEPFSILYGPGGTLYGTTFTGGDTTHHSTGDGVVFELTPATR